MIPESFQSRNRVSSNFNDTAAETQEFLQLCFNLVIEYLLISTHTCNHPLRIHNRKFQSRNRVSSNFNCGASVFTEGSPPAFQSRNRVSSNFN